MSIFNEDSLRAAVVSVWGEHGAHVDVLDELIRRAPLGPRPRARSRLPTLVEQSFTRRPPSPKVGLHLT